MVVDDRNMGGLESPELQSKSKGFKSLSEAPSKRVRSGADYHAKKDRWRGVIEFKRKVYRSPYFLTKKEAEDWYEAKSFELYGYDRVNDLQLKDVEPTRGDSNAPPSRPTNKRTGDT